MDRLIYEVRMVLMLLRVTFHFYDIFSKHINAIPIFTLQASLHLMLFEYFIDALACKQTVYAYGGSLHDECFLTCICL